MLKYLILLVSLMGCGTAEQVMVGTLTSDHIQIGTCLEDDDVVMKVTDIAGHFYYLDYIPYFPEEMEMIIQNKQLFVTKCLD